MFFPPGASVIPVVTREGLYSITTPRVAREIAGRIRQELEQEFGHVVIQNATVTDGTAGMGGNVIQFAQVFRQVNAVELSRDNYAALVHNLRAYGVKAKTINGDCTVVIPHLSQDVIFIDPPWTGLDYQRDDSINLQLSGRDIALVVAEWLPHVRLVAIKVPGNYNFAGFQKKIKGARLHRISNYGLITIMGKRTDTGIASQ